jgi:hypothetical protein
MSPGYPLQFGVNQRYQSLERRLVPTVPGHEQLGDFMRWSNRAQITGPRPQSVRPGLYAFVVLPAFERRR